jgi:signal transduction histidine kinase
MNRAVNAFLPDRVRLPHTSSLIIASLAVVGVVLIALVDALSGLHPALGLLLCVPVLLSSLSAKKWAILTTGGAALGALLLATPADLALTTAGISPSPLGGLMEPRATAFAALFASVGLALLLQHQRGAADLVRDSAVQTGELNRLLMSLLAHDLRAPLALADQGFEYVEDCAAGGYPVDRTLVADVRARLHRSLRAIEMVLAIGREANVSASAMLKNVEISGEIEQEVASFAYEARTRGKELRTDLDAIAGERRLVNLLVLRQALSIPLDNAVRYSVPGPVHISAVLTGGQLEIRVADSGPGLSAHRLGGERSDGSGIGLQLCAALLLRCGGALRVERDGQDGTTVAVVVPADIGTNAESDAPALFPATLAGAEPPPDGLPPHPQLVEP